MTSPRGAPDPYLVHPFALEMGSVHVANPGMSTISICMTADSPITRLPRSTIENACEIGTRCGVWSPCAARKYRSRFASVT